MEENSRTGFYIAMILVIVLLIGCAIFLFWMLFASDGRDAAPPKEDEAVEEPELPDAEKEPDLQPEISEEPYQPPELTGEEEALDPNLEEHLYGTLRLAYDKNAVRAESDDPKTRITLLSKRGEELPRLDAQILNGTGLSESERIRLAAGLVQGYYTDPPASSAIEISPDGEGRYLAAIPAVGETPAMSARVRFLPAGTKLWYVILLYPKGTMPDDALATAFEGASVA